MYEKKKVILAMSGGVDSSVSAWLLLKKGYAVEGLFMKNWDEDDSENYCSAKIDYKDAQSVCKKLGIALHSINFSMEYWEQVFKKFIAGYKKGDTPNPDILCNKMIKFKLCFNFALKHLQSDYFATGHYASIKKHKKKYFLYKAADLQKDQSYFLYTLTSRILSKVLFPLSQIKKIQTRRIAKKIQLCVYKKKDSTGICFIQPKKFNSFLNKYIPYKIGRILTMSGEFLGVHLGYAYYTIGQRKGLNIGGKKNKNMYPWYVVKKDINTNTIFAVQGSRNPYLLSFGFFTKKIHWINLIFNHSFLTCTVKMKYRQEPVLCQIILDKKHSSQVLFKEPSVFVTAGQSAVFYHHEQCLGGAIIKKSIAYLP
ncbi:tRNA 2-thiouridine(34) synthase MnmA [Buchnera aphidicola]|uniref:tRNA 2-thiouridine(34) synthase MnmA n=1 Tax=Buchnera aphidicola TaxID=9 RepID=UPI00094DE319|nr:tRNA 2-thiouridine(34) synthase MnmA [Buchnera aphidicola]